MLLIEKIRTDLCLRDLANRERDILLLGWEDRRRGRQRTRTRRGTEIALALPTGTILKDGDILHADSRSYIAVEAAREPLIRIHPGNVQEAALLAYEIGNRHLPISITEESIITPREGLLEEFLAKNGIDYTCAKEIFEPVRRAHTHG